MSSSFMLKMSSLISFSTVQQIYSLTQVSRLQDLQGLGLNCQCTTVPFTLVEGTGGHIVFLNSHCIS